MAKSKKELKVKPGKKDKELRDKAKALILKHPEVMHNARNLFHNENGKTIIEEKVPRGDEGIESSIMPRNQGDLRESDLKAIIKEAKGLIDDVLKGYDDRVAAEDALSRAIASMDGGKYAGKLNASTYNVLLDSMVKS